MILNLKSAKSSENLSKFVFLGQKIYFEKTTYSGLVDGLESNFVPYTYGEPWEAAYSQVLELNPQVVVIYRPEVYDESFLKALNQEFITVGYFTEPLPFPGHEAEYDLLRRFSPFSNYDFSNCDLNISYNSITCHALSLKSKITFSHPIPVSDKIFSERGVGSYPSRGIFLGRVTPERNEYLMPLKHKFNLTVVDHGELDEKFFHDYIIGINLHSDTYPNFENRVLYHMAQSMIVLTQQVVPSYNLVNEKHYFIFNSPKELEDIYCKIINNVDLYREVSRNGHHFAKNYSTSNFLKKLIKEIRKEL